MQTTIDKAGRVVIPAPLRVLAGLLPGTEIEVSYEEGSIRLVRRVPGPKVERVGRLPLASPRVPAKDRPPIDMAKRVEEERSRWPW